MNLRQSPNIPSVQHASITATCYDHSGMFLWLCPDSFILRTSEVFQHEKKHDFSFQLDNWNVGLTTEMG